MSLKAAKSQGKETVFPGEEKEGERKEERIHFSLVCLVPAGSSDDPGCPGFPMGPVLAAQTEEGRLWGLLYRAVFQSPCPEPVGQAGLVL